MVEDADALKDAGAHVVSAAAIRDQTIFILIFHPLWDDGRNYATWQPGAASKVV